MINDLFSQISDHKCPPPKPPTTEMCNIPSCDDLSLGPVRRIESKRTRNKELTDTFREGPVYTVSINTTESEIGPEYSFNAAAGWLYTEWSEVGHINAFVGIHHVYGIS